VFSGVVEFLLRYLGGLNPCSLYGEAEAGLKPGFCDKTPAHNSLSHTTTLNLLGQYITFSWWLHAMGINTSIGVTERE
jgi:hypothetical protein